MDYKLELGKIYEYCTKHRKLNISDGDDFSRGESATLNKVQLLIKVVLKEAESSKKPALNIADVSKQRELLIAFKTWEVDNDIKNLLPEQLADFYLDESN